MRNHFFDLDNEQIPNLVYKPAFFICLIAIVPSASSIQGTMVSEAILPSLAAGEPPTGPGISCPRNPTGKVGQPYRIGFASQERNHFFAEFMNPYRVQTG
jgi:hypothetical protein